MNVTQDQIRRVRRRVILALAASMAVGLLLGRYSWGWGVWAAVTLIIINALVTTRTKKEDR